MWDEDKHLPNDNYNSYETAFALESIIRFLERPLVKVEDKIPKNGECYGPYIH